jgi:hypothetical protein
MTTLMLVILAVWFVALFLGPPIWLALGLAAVVFLQFAGIPDLAVAHAGSRRSACCSRRRCSS